MLANNSCRLTRLLALLLIFTAPAWGAESDFLAEGRFGQALDANQSTLAVNPLFPFSDRLPSVFSALGEKANS
jgi:hypothetical protein